MTYLQSKPIHNNSQQQQQQQQHQENEEDDDLFSLESSNQMVEVVRKLQRGTRTVQQSFQAINR